MKDPYQVLGVERDATPEEIKGAFRKLAAQHHPDKNPDDDDAQQRFKEINAAYQILSDPQKRAAFDRFGSAGGFGGSPFGNAPGGFGGGFPGGMPFGGVPFDMSEVQVDGIFGDLLSALGFKFGERGVVRYELSVSLAEAVFGCTKTIRFERMQGCDGCQGSGAASGSQPVVCTTCQGRGVVRFQQPMLPITLERTCTACGGRGRRVTEPCSECRGAGLKTASAELEVTLPAGVEDGVVKRVPGAGSVVQAGKPAGDLEIHVRVAPHPVFRRSGADLLCRHEVSFFVAALGGEVELETLDGRGKLRVPAGTQVGAVLRIKGKGVPRGGARGDLLVEIGVDVPKQMTPEQREALVGAAQVFDQVPQAVEVGFVDRMKRLFGGE